MPTQRLSLGHTAVLVVDMQQRLLPVINDPEPVEAGVVRLLKGAAALGLPILVTEQYPKGLGPTVPGVAACVEAAACRVEKLKFSACVAPIREHLFEHGMRSVLVCGIEAHVCVLQTCLDLVDAGFGAAVVVDAIGSRRALDRDVAISRMIQAGVIPTTVESALLELVHEAGGDRFKAVLPVVK